MNQVSVLLAALLVSSPSSEASNTQQFGSPAVDLDAGQFIAVAACAAPIGPIAGRGCRSSRRGSEPIARRTRSRRARNQHRLGLVPNE